MWVQDLSDQLRAELWFILPLDLLTMVECEMEYTELWFFEQIKMVSCLNKLSSHDLPYNNNMHVNKIPSVNNLKNK
jgi:hypothetical protein